jgi:uncharacterized protein YrrD
MATSTVQVLRYTEIVGRPMLDRQTVEELGRMDRVMVDAQAQTVTGLVCKSGLLGNTKTAYAWGQIEAIGDDSILVRAEGEDMAASPDAAVVPIGFEMLTDSGNKVGEITDLLFNPDSGAVVGYLYSPSGWKGLMEGTYTFNPVAISSLGDHRMIVLERAVEDPQHYAPGLGDKIHQTTAFFQADYERTKQDLTQLHQGAKGMVNQDN